jgi:hypothetical protein
MFRKAGIANQLKTLTTLACFLLITFSALASAYLPKTAYAASNTPAINGSLLPGVSNGDNSPPSSTIAANASEELELTNTSFEVLNHKKVINTDTTSNLFNANGYFVSDPQTIWDASTNRFYISMFENQGSTSPDEGLVWGFSKNADPTSASDFCTYFNNYNYGATSFPDREDLGDSANFILITSDRFTTAGESLVGSDVAWITKPGSAAYTSCPSASSFGTGITALKNADGTAPFAPTPARQVDSSATSYILATPSYVGASSMTEFSVTKAANGSAVIGAPKSVPVPAYSAPPPAPQAGKSLSGAKAMPLQTRIYLTQTIMSVDPRLNQTELWTAHTIAGGAGSVVKWYEINPVTLKVAQQGTVSNPKLYVYNGTITPDREVNGKKFAFGDSAVVNVNTSSSKNYTAIQMVSVVSGQPESPLVMVQQSTGPDVDFTCFEVNAVECRWGDYSGSVPDPSAPITGAHGQVWTVNQWNIPDIDDSTPVWQTSVWNSKIL